MSDELCIVDSCPGCATQHDFTHDEKSIPVTFCTEQHCSGCGALLPLGGPR